MKKILSFTLVCTSLVVFYPVSHQQEVVSSNAVNISMINGTVPGKPSFTGTNFISMSNGTVPGKPSFTGANFISMSNGTVPGNPSFTGANFISLR